MVLELNLNAVKLVQEEAIVNLLWSLPGTSLYYPLANEVAMGYSNATIRPSFRNILVNTLESTSFNGFWPNLVHT